jgi:arginine exporter protein ArgO
MTKQFYNQPWFWFLIVTMLLAVLAEFLGHREIIPWLGGFVAIMAFGYAFRYVIDNS